MTINKFKAVKIKDVGKVITGKTPPTSQPELFGDKYPFITPSDIPSFDVRYIDFVERGLSDKGFDKQKRYALPKDTVCYVCIGSTIGKVCLTNKVSFTNQQINSIVVNRDKFNPKYVYYLLRAETPKIQAISGGTGAGKAILNKSSFEDIDLNVYPLPIQNKIAAILSAYDDLIENNTRSIKILEEMAQLLYREWFVKFRFPGHEKVRMVESELGPIPEGWKVKKVSVIAKIFRGKSYKSSDIANDGEGLPFLNLKCIERDGGFRYDGIKWFSGQYKDAQIAKAGDIIMAVTDMTQERRIVARTARVPRMFNVEKYVFSMDLVKIVPLHEVVNEYLYSVFRYSTFPDKVKQHANGANVLHLNPDHIANFEMLIAPTYLQNKYANIVKNLYAECDVLQMKNTILRRTRDLLLPKLISGELDVEDLDIAVGGD
jgi:type I restriction enzyme S subunit